MEVRAEFLIDYAAAHGPVHRPWTLIIRPRSPVSPASTRQIPVYAKVQRQVLSLRREGRLDYGDISDATRWMRKPTINTTASRTLLPIPPSSTARKLVEWDAPTYVEIWCEKDALAGTIYPVTSKFDVPLMVARGFASETFCYEAIARARARPALLRLLPRRL